MNLNQKTAYKKLYWLNKNFIINNKNFFMLAAAKWSRRTTTVRTENTYF